MKMITTVKVLDPENFRHFDFRNLSLLKLLDLFSHQTLARLPIDIDKSCWSALCFVKINSWQNLNNLSQNESPSWLVYEKVGDFHQS